MDMSYGLKSHRYHVREPYRAAREDQYVRGKVDDISLKEGFVEAHIRGGARFPISSRARYLEFIEDAMQQGLIPSAEEMFTMAAKQNVPFSEMRDDLALRVLRKQVRAKRDDRALRRGQDVGRLKVCYDSQNAICGVIEADSVYGRLLQNLRDQRRVLADDSDMQWEQYENRRAEGEIVSPPRIIPGTNRVFPSRSALDKIEALKEAQQHWKD